MQAQFREAVSPFPYWTGNQETEVIADSRESTIEFLKKKQPPKSSALKWLITREAKAESGRNIYSAKTCNALEFWDYYRFNEVGKYSNTSEPSRGWIRATQNGVVVRTKIYPKSGSYLVSLSSNKNGDGFVTWKNEKIDFLADEFIPEGYQIRGTGMIEIQNHTVWLYEKGGEIKKSNFYHRLNSESMVLAVTSKDNNKILYFNDFQDEVAPERIRRSILGKEDKNVTAQMLYDLREKYEFCSGNDLHQFFTNELRDPSPSGKDVLPSVETAQKFVSDCINAIRHNCNDPYLLSETGKRVSDW